MIIKKRTTAPFEGSSHEGDHDSVVLHPGSFPEEQEDLLDGLPSVESYKSFLILDEAVEEQIEDKNSSITLEQPKDKETIAGKLAKFVGPFGFALSGSSYVVLAGTVVVVLSCNFYFLIGASQLFNWQFALTQVLTSLVFAFASFFVRE